MKNFSRSEIIDISKKYAYGNIYITWKLLAQKHGVQENYLKRSIYTAIEDSVIELPLAYKIRDKAIFNCTYYGHSSSQVEEHYIKIFQTRQDLEDFEENESSIKKFEKNLESDQISNDISNLELELSYWKNQFALFEENDCDSLHDCNEEETYSLQFIERKIAEINKSLLNVKEMF